MSWFSYLLSCFTNRRTGRFSLALTFLIAVCLNATAITASAGADATIGPENEQGPSGLPDGRLYEEASPPNKFGNQLRTIVAFAASDGHAVMYSATGALGENASNGAFDPEFVSERTSHGWTTRSVMPLPTVGPVDPEEYLTVTALPTLLVPSADLSRTLFGTNGELPYVGAPDVAEISNNVFLEGPDPFAEPDWVGRSHIDGSPAGANPEAGASPNGQLLVAGTSPDLKTIYFFYEGELLPGASGLYEYKEGVLSDVGVLPAGESGVGVAVPAAQPNHGGLHWASPAALDGQVSADGSRIFFTRKDQAGELELYAHVTASDGSQRVVLISRSQIAGHMGEPASDGPLAVPSTEPIGSESEKPEHALEEGPPSYVFASPDGSHAFFQSTDKLTEDAPEDSTAKTYEFDLATEALAYVPLITGSIVTVSNDGSSLVVENTTTTPFRLERWVGGPTGGVVTPIAQLPSVSPNTCKAVLCVGPVYASSDSKVVVFASESPIPGFNDGGTHYKLSPVEYGEQPEGSPLPNTEVFRYDAESHELSCVSCPPTGTVPSGNATLSRAVVNANARFVAAVNEVITPGKAISTDGRQVFFETRQALLPQDTNGTADVYEWNDGVLYLISSGHSQEPSFFDGISESGGDVFFMTTEGISPGDTDGGFDVYDARVPRPGDNPPPEAVQCTGAVCQGPPSVPQLLGQPASEAFSGAGDVTPVALVHVKAKSLTRAQKLARALKVCKRDKKIRKRGRCEKKARSKYRAVSARQHAGPEGHNNGRGK